MISFGPQVCGTLGESAGREWLVADGLGGYAMGTVAGLRTRRYHALLVVASANGAARHVGLAALDAVVVIGDERVRLATHEWSGGTVDPRGHELLARFDLIDGVPRWTWAFGGIVIQREIAMTHGSPTVAVTHRLVAADGPVRCEVAPLCTWRDAHGERHGDGDPSVEVVSEGFVFEGNYRVTGPGWQPGGAWFRNAHLREEAARGLPAEEDLWAAGTFTAQLSAGESLDIVATADLGAPIPTASQVVEASRERARRLVASAQAADGATSLLVLAADQFIVGSESAPAVVAGYPWFGAWSRDTMTSYEGLFLATGRAEQGRALLVQAADTVSEGMLANTADTGTLEYNTADGTLWFLHAVARHVDVTDDTDLGSRLATVLSTIIDDHVAGTRYGIVVDPADGLLRQGAAGVALTWMDARIEGRPVTPRIGKAVEINALWINALRSIAQLLRTTASAASGSSMVAGSAATASKADRIEALGERAAASFTKRFTRPDGLGLFDVVDGPNGDDASVRPNQLLALSLPFGPGGPPSVLRVCREQLLTPLGMRSLTPADDAYRGVHRGDSRERDEAYHEGTVWPWLIGPFADAARAAKIALPLFDGLDAHLGEFGLGSVSETADGAAPHGATGCPFQAWSVAEVLRTRSRA